MGNLLDPRPGASPPGASGLGDSGPGDSGSGNSRPAPPTGSPANQPEPPADLSPAADPGTTAEPDPAPPLPEVPLMSAAEQDEALAKVRELIRRADWKRMKTEAEALTVARLSDRNQSQAEALYEVADLATYYREGIERAVEELQVGNDFAITNALRVIVVETGDDLLTIRYNKRNRSFSFNEFPFSLAHKLASFQVPNNPTGQAAQAVYQAVAPKSTDAYREEAIERLAAIDGQVEGADPVRLAETIELIYQSAEP
jgi:hypothetical protein